MYFYRKNRRMYLFNSQVNKIKKYEIDSISEIFSFPKKQINSLGALFESKDTIINYYKTFKDKKVGLFDENLNQLILAENQSIFLLDDFILVKKDYLFGIYDKKGKNILPIEYEKIIVSGDFFILRKNKKYGFSDQAGNILLPMEYDKIEATDYNSFFITQSYKMGIADINGNVLVPPAYSEINYLSDNFLLVENSYKKGVISLDNKTIIPIEYNTITFPYEKSFITTKNNQFGLISTNGKTLISPQYENITPLSDKILKIKKDTAIGAINYEGKGIIPPCFKDLETTSNPYLFFTKTFHQVETAKYSSKTKKIEPINVNLYGVANIHNQILLDTLYFKSSIDTYLEYVKLNLDTINIIINIDEKGRFIEKLELKNFISYGVEYHEEKVDNYWKLGRNNVEEWYDTWGLFKSNGAIIIRYQFDRYASNFLNNPDLVLTVKNDYYGIVNQKKGIELIEPSYKKIHVADLDSANVIRCYFSNGTCQLIDQNLKIIDNIYPSYIDDYQNGTTRIGTRGKLQKSRYPKAYNLNVNNYHNENYNEYNNGRWGVLDADGKYTTTNNYLFIQKQFRNKYIAKNKDKKWGIINAYENIYLDFEYDELRYFCEQPDNSKWIDIEFLKAKNGQKWGVIDTNNQQIIDYKYDELKYFGNSKGHFFGVCENNKWGVIDIKDSIIVPIIFDSIQFFNDKNKIIFQTFNLEPHSGYIDKSGRAVVAPEYLTAKNFYEGFARVEIARKKWSFIDSTSYELITDTTFNSANDFSEGLATVKIGKKWGAINKNGKIIIEPQFIEIGQFKSGLAYAKAKTKKTLFGKQKSRYGYIDSTGNFIIKNKYKKCTDFKGELAFVKKRKYYAMINLKGNKKSAFKYKNISELNEYGIYRVTDRYKKLSLINLEGKKIVRSGKYEKIGKFNEEMASVKKRKKYGFINTKGELIFKPTFNKVEDYKNGFAIVMINNKFGFINKDSLVIAPQFKKCSNFINGMALVKDSLNEIYCINTKGEKIEDSLAIINYNNNFKEYILTVDTNGYFYTNPILKTSINKFFIEAQDFENNKAIVRIESNYKYGILKPSGSYFLTPRVDNIGEFENNYSTFTTNIQTGLYNCSGKQIAYTIFTEIEQVGNLIKLIRPDQTIIIDQQGKVVWE